MTDQVSIEVRAFTDLAEPCVGIRVEPDTEWVLIKPYGGGKLAHDIDGAVSEAKRENERRRRLEDRHRPCQHITRFARATKVSVDEYGITTWQCGDCDETWRNGGALDDHIQISKIDMAVCIACGEANLDGDPSLDSWAMSHPDGRGGLCTPETREAADSSSRDG